MIKPLPFDFQSADMKRDPWRAYAELRARGPVVKVRVPLLGNLWLTTTHDAAAELLKDQDRFGMDPASAGKKLAAGLRFWMPPVFKMLADNMLLKDEPDHKRLRKLVDQAFHRQDIERLRGRMHAIAAELLDPFAGASTMDLAQDFARPFPLYVIAEILGLPEQDRARFRSLASGAMPKISFLGFMRMVPKVRGLAAYLRAQFEDCRRAPRPGLISALVEARDGGEKLTDSELLAMTFLLLMAGHETTSHLISVGVLTLLQHPEQKHALMSDWSGVGLATEEILRFAGPVPFTKPRYVRRDCAFHGQNLKRGDLVMACIGSANTDPAAIERADVFDAKRKPNPHLAFGTGIHFCLGLQLARAEAHVAYRELFTRFPDMVLAGPLEWGGGALRNLNAMPVSLKS